MKRKPSPIILLLISLCFFMESKGQIDPLKKLPNAKPEVKTASENVNIAVKITGMSEWDGMIGYDGVAEQTRVIQINFRTDPAATGSARIGAALYFEYKATRKIIYNPGNSLYARYTIEEYEQIVPKLQKALSEGKEVWMVYSKTGTVSRFDIKIDW